MAGPAQFEEHRSHLRAVAYRMLGSARRGRRRRPGGVVAAQPHRRRRDREPRRLADHGGRPGVPQRAALAPLEPREEPLAHVPDPIVSRDDSADPEHEALLADSVGLALLVVLETLTPAERLAFVLHDMFAVPFEEVAPIAGRSPDAARQLASRARRRVQVRRRRPTATSTVSARSSTPSSRPRGGDFDALVAVLDPDVVLRSDGGAARPA